MNGTLPIRWGISKPRLTTVSPPTNQPCHVIVPIRSKDTKARIATFWRHAAVRSKLLPPPVERALPFPLGSLHRLARGYLWRPRMPSRQLQTSSALAGFRQSAWLLLCPQSCGFRSFRKLELRTRNSGKAQLLQLVLRNKSEFIPSSCLVIALNHFAQFFGRKADALSHAGGKRFG